MKIPSPDGNATPLLAATVANRLAPLIAGLNADFVSIEPVVDATMEGAYDGIPAADLDVLTAETAAALTTRHPDYAILAARVAVTALYEKVPASFGEVVEALYEWRDEKRAGVHSPIVSLELRDIAREFADRIEPRLRHERDMDYAYFGFKTLERTYLLRRDGRVAERPQHMLMRVAFGIHGRDVDAALETYDLMSTGWLTHASPTLFNAGTPRAQMSSCFLVASKGDSIEGIYDTVKECASISKYGGGVGLQVHDVRARDSYIAGTNGRSNGLVPMLRVYNETARYVDQGGNKRPGAFAVYLEPWHADVYAFLDCRKNHGAEELRARDLFFGLWIPDLFMRRVSADESWTLMCPAECPGLSDVWGTEFDALYERYEREGRGRATVAARHLWRAILTAQTETGTPYMLYKDACNAKSNHGHLGTIKCSNLCTEIIEFSAPGETAVCNLASVPLNRFAVAPAADGSAPPLFDFAYLREVTRAAIRNLDRVIDRNYYPNAVSRASNFRHRPVGLGVQGLADAFAVMGYAFGDENSRRLNERVFAHMYFAAVDASCELARERGVYPSYEGSPASRGRLQYHLWGRVPLADPALPWKELEKRVATYGLRNSLLLAPMPTASTAQILGNNESFEPFSRLLFTRRVLSGEFQIANRHLVEALATRGLWDEEMRNEIVARGGSVVDVARVPPELRERFRTAWEISQKTIIDMAADRGAYVCQSQSMSLHVAEPSYATLSSMHFYAWKKGLKTGMYYLRTKPAANPVKFTVDQDALGASVNGLVVGPSCARDKAECASCSA